MSVVSAKELFRTSVFEIGQTYALTREWVCILSDDAIGSPTNEVEIATFLDIDFGRPHPTYPRYKARKITIKEGHGDSPYHVHVVAEYGIVLQRELITPADRAAVWEFDSSPGEIPALYYYDGAGNGSMRPLTNSAYDYFQGLVTQEMLIVARITKNFSTRPDSWITAQNCVNDSVYLGGAAHSWKVASVRVTQEQEEFNNGIVTYWQAIADLQYRQTGHNYQLPDVGFNFLGGGQKRRCMVFDFQNAEWIPSPTPVGLNGSGAQTLGVPAILNRRVNPVADFTATFGVPPTSPLPA